MFLPIISFADGYGFTYGGRVSTLDLLGLDERLSVPLTWGGTRRAAVEFERLFERGPLTRIDSSVAIWNRRTRDSTSAISASRSKGRAERVFGDIVRARPRGEPEHHQLRRARDSLWTVGTTVAVDTRLDPAYSRQRRARHRRLDRHALRPAARPRQSLHRRRARLPADVPARWSSPDAPPTSAPSARCRRTNGCCSAAPRPPRISDR